MVATFWGMETRGAGLRARAASTGLRPGIDSSQCTQESLELMGCRSGTYNHHGVMLKVELESGGLHSVLIEGLRRKSTESRSLFSKGKSE